jgi:hypothetical protein
VLSSWLATFRCWISLHVPVFACTDLDCALLRTPCRSKEKAAGSLFAFSWHITPDSNSYE